MAISRCAVCPHLADSCLSHCNMIVQCYKLGQMAANGKNRPEAVFTDFSPMFGRPGKADPDAWVHLRRICPDATIKVHAAVRSRLIKSQDLGVKCNDLLGGGPLHELQLSQGLIALPLCLMSRKMVRHCPPPKVDRLGKRLKLLELSSTPAPQKHLSLARKFMDNFGGSLHLFYPTDRLTSQVCHSRNVTDR